MTKERDVSGVTNSTPHGTLRKYADTAPQFMNGKDHAAEASSNVPAERKGNGLDKPIVPRIITPTFWIPRDPKSIPRRQCLYGNHYYRKFVSTTAAPGGRGKSSLDMVEAVAKAMKLPLLGVPVPKRLRVWYWNGEDPREEIDRRILAICLHFNIDQTELAEWLCTDNGRETPIHIAGQQGNKTVFGPDAEALAKALISNSMTS
jgi:hypothetical protein